jgi:hypothetical protein
MNPKTYWWNTSFLWSIWNCMEIMEWDETWWNYIPNFGPGKFPCPRILPGGQAVSSLFACAYRVTIKIYKMGQQFRNDWLYEAVLYLFITYFTTYYIYHLLYHLFISLFNSCDIWQCVKTLYPCSSHQTSWDLWMFIPLKMVLIGIDPYPYVGVSDNSVPHLPNGFADHYPY